MSLITPHLFLGNARQARDKKFLLSKNIKFVVNCAIEVPNFHPNTFRYLRLDLKDIPTQSISDALIKSSKIITDEINNGSNVFVHCAAGISRSSSTVIYAIMQLYGWNFQQAIEYTKTMHPNTNPNPGFIKALEQFPSPKTSKINCKV